MAPTFDGARDKLVRAEKHLDVAMRAFTCFLRRECRTVEKIDHETQMVEWVMVAPKPPQRLSLVVGDCVHNLRSALDYLVYELVSANPHRPADTPNDRTMFPICDTHKGYRRQIDKVGRLRGLPEHLAAVIQGLQPYHRRDRPLDHTRHPLWILNKLENIDKHRRLTLTCSIGVNSVALVRQLDGDRLFFNQKVRDGAVVARFPLPKPGGGDVEMQGKVSCYVAFDEPNVFPFEVDPVRILDEILDCIRDRVIPRLEKAVP